MTVPIPTPIYRFIHIDNLHIYLKRAALHTPKSWPKDGLKYKTCHNKEVQEKRSVKSIPCGPKGVLHDYVPFYFGSLSPMMLNLKTGRVPGYNEGQEPLVYLVTTCQVVQDSDTNFVFSDGHGIARFTSWFDSLNKLDEIDWPMINERYWADNPNDNDRQRRKQAEFLVHESCPWELIQSIGVINDSMKKKVEKILSDFDEALRKPVVIKRDWYYY